MAKANVNLLNSILWNLREINKLAEKIKKHCGDVDCTSWRYPLTSCSELEVFKLLQNNRNLDNYTYVLELTYDRLLYLFNLMIKYLESSDSLKKFRPNKNVYRPKTLSLAAVIHMIWDRIQAQVEGTSQGCSPEVSKPEMNGEEKTLTLTDLNASKSTIYTQSEVCSISVCSCCEMVQQFVTQLVQEVEKIIEKQDFCSAISSERKFMREYLVEMTSWSAMSRWLAAILKDFTTLTEKVEQANLHSRKLKHRLESGEKKMKFRTEQQEEETRKLEIRLKDQEQKMIDLKQKLEKLTEEKNSLKDQLKQKSSELSARSSQFEVKIEELKKSYEIKLKEKKEKKLQKEKEKEQELIQKLETESRKSQEMENQNEKLEKNLLQMKENLELLSLKTIEDRNSLLNRIQELENQVESLQEEKLGLHSIIEDKEKKIKDYSMKIIEAFPELHDVPDSQYTASGNPEFDMECQVEANNIRINLLQSENEKLLRTLNKIKSLKG